MPEPVVRVQGVTKLFKSSRAVDGVSFEAYPGEIVGIVGPNGAGKTTLIHMLFMPSSSATSISTREASPG